MYGKYYLYSLTNDEPEFCISMHNTTSFIENAKSYDNIASAIAATWLYTPVYTNWTIINDNMDIIINEFQCVKFAKDICKELYKHDISMWDTMDKLSTISHVPKYFCCVADEVYTVNKGLNMIFCKDDDELITARMIFGKMHHIWEPEWENYFKNSII